MIQEQIIVAGVSGEEIGDELLREINGGFDLLISAETTRLILEKNLKRKLDERWLPVVPLKNALKRISEAGNGGKIIVVTSGDPLFFGLGTTILKQMPGVRVRIVPAVSSMQQCFSRFSIPWERASFLSLHGRPIDDLFSHLDKELLFILTDEKNSPQHIAEILLAKLSEKELAQYVVMVGERLGFEDERLFNGDLGETAGAVFRSPNCLILKRESEEFCKKKSRLGLKEAHIRHSRGLITKDEIRAAVLHKLSLPQKGVFWDVGSGSGSISIEASRLNPDLRIFSIERKKQEIENITHNINSFGCKNIQVIHGTAPEMFSRIPEPDCVFIGGSGGCLEDIVKYLGNTTRCSKVVITAVTEKTCTQAPLILLENNFIVHTSVISVSRYSLLPGQEKSGAEEKLNTIHVISGEKENEKK